MTYTDEFLINRLFDGIQDTSSKKLTIPVPIIIKKNRKTFIENFNLICNSINRDVEIVRDYYEKNMGLSPGDVTLSANNVLTITGPHDSLNIIKHLENYIMTFVICKEKKCGSSNTTLIKENRIQWIICKKCNCKSAIR